MTVRKKILMFGWEFPPAISGGLGVATLGLCKAIAQFADVRMIIPKNVPDFHIENIDLVGLNSIGIEELHDLFKDEIPAINHFSNAQFMQEIGPYSKIPLTEFLDQTYYQNNWQEITPFELTDLYGGDVISKVMEYERIAVRYCLQDNFDVIHAHDWLTFLPAMHLKMITGKPLVIHIHSTEFDRTGVDSNNWVFELERRAMELADYIVPVSNYTGNICIQHYGADPKKIKPIHNGICNVALAHRNKVVPMKLVIFFGRVTEQKGPEYFVEAAKKVLQYMPNTHFVLAGNGELLHPLMQKIASYGLGNQFFFTNFLNKEKLNELLAMADLYCMPSKSEPFGLSAVEAAQYGIPTIISKTSGVAEVLPGAIKIDFDDVGKLAAYIIASLSYNGLNKSVIDSNKNSLKKITWENCAEEVMQVYNSLFEDENSTH